MVRLSMGRTSLLVSIILGAVFIVGVTVGFFAKPFQPTGHQSFNPSETPDYFHDALNLPSCGSRKELFSVSPITLTDFIGIVPLGTLAPTSHVLPTHHLYFHPRREDPNNVGSLPAHVPAFAPGDVTITEIRFTASKERPDFDDASYFFAPCREVKAYLDHFKTMASNIRAAYEAAPTLRCDEYQRSYRKFGTLTFTHCIKTVNISVKAGEQIGTAGGGEGQMVFDFGASDKRVRPATLANPQRWLGQEQKQYTVCPLDYFTSEIGNQLKARLGNPDSSQKRTIEPVCGQANWDLPGTAQGVWIAEGEEYVGHENPHLALAYDNTDPTIGVISMGLSGERKGFFWGTYNFRPQDTGLVNRDFKDITADGEVYCFDTEDTYRNNAPATVILTMPTPTTVKIEKLNQSSCGSGPWPMRNYSEFER